MAQKEDLVEEKSWTDPSPIMDRTFFPRIISNASFCSLNRTFFSRFLFLFFFHSFLVKIRNERWLSIFEASLQDSVVDVKAIARFSEKGGMNKLEFMRDQRSCSFFLFLYKCNFHKVLTFLNSFLLVILFFTMRCNLFLKSYD